MRADRDTDVTMDVIDDDIVPVSSRPSLDAGVRHPKRNDLRALMSCPTKRVEPRNYREAQEEARLGRLRMLGRIR